MGATPSHEDEEVTGGDDPEDTDDEDVLKMQSSVRFRVSEPNIFFVYIVVLITMQLKKWFIYDI